MCLHASREETQSSKRVGGFERIFSPSQTDAFHRAKYIEGLELTDYRVRILDGGTEAVTRVLIESRDETGERWTTVGVSPNIIEASFQALMDSIVYKLVKSGAPG